MLQEQGFFVEKVDKNEQIVKISVLRAFNEHVLQMLTIEQNCILAGRQEETLYTALVPLRHLGNWAYMNRPLLNDIEGLFIWVEVISASEKTFRPVK